MIYTGEWCLHFLLTFVYQPCLFWKVFLVLFFLHSEQNSMELLWGWDSFFLEQNLPSQYGKSAITVCIYSSFVFMPLNSTIQSKLTSSLYLYMHLFTKINIECNFWSKQGTVFIFRVLISCVRHLQYRPPCHCDLDLVTTVPWMILPVNKVFYKHIILPPCVMANIMTILPRF